MIGWHHNTDRGTNHRIVERKDNLPAQLRDIPK